MKHADATQRCHHQQFACTCQQADDKHMLFAWLSMLLTACRLSMLEQSAMLKLAIVGTERTKLKAL